MLVQAKKNGEGLANPIDPHHTPTIIQPSTSQPQRKQRPRKTKRKDTEVPQPSGPITNVADEAVYEEMDASRVTGARNHGANTIAQTRSENVSKHSNDPLLARGNTLQSGEDRLKLKELMEFCTKLQQRVLDLENTKTAQAQEITSLKLRVKNLEKKGRRSVLDDEEVFAGQDMAEKEINVVEKEVSTADLVTTASEVVSTASLTKTIINDELTLAQTLIRAKGIVFHEQEQEQEQAPTPIVSSQQPTHVKDKELAFKLQAEEDEEERLAREKAQKVEEANIAWDDIQGKVKADYQLAQRLQAQEQEELSDAEKATLFIQLLENRIKHFAAKRAEEKRNRPPTKAQQRSFMCTYLKNMEGWKPKDLKNMSFANIQDLFDKAMKKVNTFVNMDTELVKESSKKAEAEIAQENSSKRVGEALEQESFKKQKVDDDKETEELKQCMEIISDDGDDITIEATPLSTKSPTIVDYKIYKEWKKSYFQIIRAYGNSQMYLTFGKMLKNFNKEDLEFIWSIVKERFKKTEPANYMDTFLHLNLKTMFEYHLKDNNILYYLLIEKMYPLTKHTLHQMFNDVKLQVDYEYEMAFELLRLVKK
ncbi:hypothetical protein Tco_1113583 [Tanacetum coccineum]|uniref:Uncharacterized protein n=1 Tax=Tanacetum coccineum TaxID=301880 RepID=A0ABQ5IU34_9ASTR